MEVAVDQYRPELETEVEEVLDVGLQARQPRRQFSTTTTTTTPDLDISSNTSAATVVHGLRKGDIGDVEQSENSVYLDKNGGALEDLDIPKILNTIQYDVKKKEKIETDIVSSEEGSDVMDEEIEEEEVVELEFEKAVPKLHTHAMHCPNCDYHITKVVLRRKLIKKKSRPVPQEEEGPDNLLGCLSCFSLFTPSGDGCFDPFSIFRNTPSSNVVPEPRQVGNEGEVVPREDGTCFSIFRVFKRGPNVATKVDPPEEDPPSPGQDQSRIKYVTSKSPIAQGENDGSNIKGETSELNGTLHTDRYIKLPQEDEPDIGFVKTPQQGESMFGVAKPTRQENSKLGFFKQPPHKESKIDVLPDTSSTNQDQTQGLVQQDSTSYEILKSIVYGGLMEVIASLSIVASAAASGATTLNIIALALANLIGGIIIIGHSLWDLRDDCYRFSAQQENQETRNKYKEILGKIEHFPLHFFVAILSFLAFGIIPPVAYGYSFHKTNDKDLTILVVAVASFLCVGLLGIFKARINECSGFLGYVKTVLYYLTIAVSVSGVSYAAGNLVARLIEEWGLFQMSSGVEISLVPDVVSRSPVLAYY